MQNENTPQTPCACDCASQITELEKQLKAARRMVESGFDRTSIVTNIEKNIEKLQKKQNQCSKK